MTRPKCLDDVSGEKPKTSLTQSKAIRKLENTMIRSFSRQVRRLSSNSTSFLRLQEESRELEKLLLNWTNRKEDRSLHVHDSFVTNQKNIDLDTLVTNFTAPALARGLRDRELTLSKLSKLAFSDKDNLKEIRDILKPFTFQEQPQSSESTTALQLPDLSKDHGLFQRKVLNRMKYRLGRIPREITSRAHKRACVVLPLCSVNNEAHLVLTERSSGLRRHSGELCFPGGMVDVNSDKSIVQAGLREMEEEIGVQSRETEVLGILRLDWVEVKALTGVAVTPVVGFIGDVTDVEKTIAMNEDEVSKVHLVSMKCLLNEANWSFNEHNFENSITFTSDNFDGKKVWGLTGYILYKFIKLLPSVSFENYREFTRSQSF